MTLSYKDIFKPEAKRIKVKAKIATNHPTSSYGQPVIVLADGGWLDIMSWTSMNYEVEKATKKELASLIKMGLI